MRAMSIIERVFSNRIISKVTWLYVLGVLAWALTYFLAGDRILYFEFINALAVYLFIPLPLLLIYAWRRNNRGMKLASGAMLVVFIVLWGPLFFPNVTPVPIERVTLKVMTYNLQGNAGDVNDSIAAIRAEDADVVLLQEVTYEVAAALEKGLAENYPWQNLDPREYANGMGILSKLPIKILNYEWTDRWNGWPQVIQVSVRSRPITLINVHLHASRPTLPSLVEKTAANRERNTATLLDVISQVSEVGPVILAGDFNVTHLSSVYRTITTQLDDAWMQAGFGFGHTFPTDAQPPGLLAWKYGIPIPQEVVRIDYIFHTADMVAIEAYRGVNLGGSDHRSLVTVLGIMDK